jgi:putative salt-induced outer membrane protein
VQGKNAFRITSDAGIFSLRGYAMTASKFTAAASVLALALLAPAAFAQTELTGIDNLDDRLDDIEDDVADDLERSEDASRFGNPEFRPGLSGSASLGYSGKTGNNESQEFSAGARLRYAQGPFVQSIGLALDFADDDGVTTKEDVFGVYDANYYFDDRFYGFVLGRVESDGLADLATEVKTDAFIGVGPGYRIINTPQMTWRVQAGVGYSFLENGIGETENEVGYIASSRFFYAFNDNIFASMDTDILNSDSALRINNDLGVNFKMTDAFSTRVSYLTEYNDSRAIRSDNKLGVSLVYGF